MAHEYEYFSDEDYQDCEDCLDHNWSSCVKCGYPKVFTNIQDIKMRVLSLKHSKEKQILYMVKHNDIYQFVIAISMDYYECSCCGNITVWHRCGCRENEYHYTEYRKVVINDLIVKSDINAENIFKKFKYGKRCVSNDDYSSYRIDIDFIFNFNDIVTEFKTFAESYIVLHAILPNDIANKIMEF